MNTVTYSLEEIIKKQKQEFLNFSQSDYIQRTKEQELRESLNSALIKIVLGPRRAGKSRLIQKVLENDKVAYLNFEEEGFLDASGDKIIEAASIIYPNAEFWYLDEIQDFPFWETFINKLHRRGYNLIITGSNAKLLSSELATALTGRHIAIELLPFSYNEYLSATKNKKSWQSFEAYLNTGGFPEIVLGKAVNNKTYLKTLFDSIILKDLVRRKKIRNPIYLTNTISLIANNVTSRTSARSLSKALQSTPSPTTIEKYLQYLREAYLVESTRPFASKIKERIQGERKPYLIDTGFIGAINSAIMPTLGKQLENSIYLELRRKGYQAEMSLFYYRTTDGKEIDFLIRNGHLTDSLIQVCLDISSIETREREVRALTKAKDEFPQAKLIIITADEFGTIKIEKNKSIELIPAYEYCKI